MSVGDWILHIILFIFALGVLITIHELGHFSMAKLFKVYCQEFSIGFGPKLIRVKKKNRETYFAIRLIPLGGYVSMFGEGVELDDGVKVPYERSLEGIHKGKKAIILVAGIVMNILMSFLLLTISNVCFPVYRATNEVTLNKTHDANLDVIQTGDKLDYIGPKDSKLVLIYDKDNNIIDQRYIVDDKVTINDKHYVLTYCPIGNKNKTDFASGILLHPGYKADDDPETMNEGDIIKEAYFRKSWGDEYLETYDGYYPDFTDAYYPSEINVVGDGEGLVHPTITLNFHGERDETSTLFRSSINLVAEKGKKNYQWKSFGLLTNVEKYWPPFGDRIKYIFIDFGTSSVAIFKGLGMLFTGNLQNVSGIVGILNQSASIFSNYSFSTYLYFWAVISINLAIFNLIPFPGLDGWALLVTAIEGITRKKVPNKVKNIVSMVGLLILFALMFVIVGLDIARWVK